MGNATWHSFSSDGMPVPTCHSKKFLLPDLRCRGIVNMEIFIYLNKQANNNYSIVWKRILTVKARPFFQKITFTNSVEIKISLWLYI